MDNLASCHRVAVTKLCVFFSEKVPEQSAHETLISPLLRSVGEQAWHIQVALKEIEPGNETGLGSTHSLAPCFWADDCRTFSLSLGGGGVCFPVWDPCFFLVMERGSLLAIKIYPDITAGDRAERSSPER